jgi:putative hydrolase of the HAD superfamily
MSPQPTADAVLFDAAGTLLHVHPSVGAVYAEEARKFGVDVSLSELDDAFRASFAARRPAATPETLKTSETIERDWWRSTVQEVFSAAGKLADFGQYFDDFFDQLFERFAEPDVWRFYDDVLPALDALKRLDLKLGIVSNWDGRLHRLIDAMDLHHFDLILTSAEAGRRKPDPLPFAIACRRLGTAPNRTLYVGDSYDDDIVGAETAGLQALLIDRKGNEAAAGVIQSLTQIPAQIQNH